MSALPKFDRESRIARANAAVPAAALYLVVSPSDESLVTAAAAGNGDAFNDLVVRHRPAALGVAESIVGREGAEDVVQDALLLAFWGLRSLRDRSGFLLWLKAITRDLAVRFGDDEIRRVWNHISLDELPLESASELATTARVFDERGRPAS